MHLELIVKEPLARGGLALYPLFSSSPAAPAYVTGPEAERVGALRIAEKPGDASVPELMVHNLGALPLLLVEGETLVGTKQNRTINASVLVPAGAATTIDVSCVEAGRWGAPQESYRSARHSPPDLRRVNAAATDHLRQSEVWSRITRYEEDLGAASATAALEDAFAARDDDVAALVAGTRPLPEQRGVAVAVGGVLRGLDCFDKPETLAAYWDGLCAGYALDAVATAPDGDIAPSELPTIAQVEALIACVLTATPAGGTAPTGLGAGRTFTGTGVVGRVLEWKGAVVHVSAFVEETA